MPESILSKSRSRARSTPWEYYAVAALISVMSMVGMVDGLLNGIRVIGGACFVAFVCSFFVWHWAHTMTQLNRIVTCPRCGVHCKTVRERGAVAMWDWYYECPRCRAQHSLWEITRPK